MKKLIVAFRNLLTHLKRYAEGCVNSKDSGMSNLLKEFSQPIS